MILRLTRAIAKLTALEVSAELSAAMNLMGLAPASKETATGHRPGAGSESQIDASALSFLNEKNFAEADKIRDELASQGIRLKDSKDSQTGERITSWEVVR